MAKKRKVAKRAKKHAKKHVKRAKKHKSTGAVHKCAVSLGSRGGKAKAKKHKK